MLSKKGKDKPPVQSLLALLQYLTMIQFFDDFDKTIFQKKYDNFVKILNLASLRCSKCSVIGGCSIHANYTRKIVTDTGKEIINILRVKCNHCRATHALLPTWIVPYSQVILDDQIEIIRQYDAGATSHQIQPSNPEIDTWNILYIIKQYLYHWKQRLLSSEISVTLKTRKLLSDCFKQHERQFMQIKRTVNSLFVQTT